MGISPSSSMSSFETTSISPRAGCSTGVSTFFGETKQQLSGLMHLAPPKKPPRRNLFSPPTYIDQTFKYPLSNHQLQSNQSCYSSNNNSHQGHVGAEDFIIDECKDDILAKHHYVGYDSDDYEENLEPNIEKDVTNLTKKKSLEPGHTKNIGTNIAYIIDSMPLKSYNPNRRLKRNRTYCSLILPSNNQASIPQSPTNYKQPPTPDHPPPSSSQAEHTIHECIRPLSQEYKRRSFWWQFQEQYEMRDISTSPILPAQRTSSTSSTNYDYIVINSDTKENITTNAGLYSSVERLAKRTSSGSLSSSVSLSDNNAFIGNSKDSEDNTSLAAVLLKGSRSSYHQGSPKKSHQQFPLQQRNIPVYATIHKKRGISMALGEQKHRPPIPARPVVPESNFYRIQPPQTHQHLLNTTIENNDGHVMEKNYLQANVIETEFVNQHKDGQAILKNNLGTKGTSLAEIISHKSFKNNNSNKAESKDNNQNRNHTLICNENSSTTTLTTRAHKNTILSPYSAEETRKKISEIIESFGNTNISPINDIYLDIEDLDIPLAQQILISRLKTSGLLYLKEVLFEIGYDNYKYMNGVFEKDDLDLLKISPLECTKLLKLIYGLPKAEFKDQKALTNSIDSKTSLQSITSLTLWLSSIELSEYIESFKKHLYNSLESVCGVWDVELQTVLEINKLGHRRRILQSIASIKERPETIKIKKSNVREQVARTREKESRHAMSAYRKNRPAPLPPCQEAIQKSLLQTSLRIRAPSELLLNLPENFRTKWRHSSNLLLNDQIKYMVYYLGSTVVKELCGTESTRKLIGEFKKYRQYQHIPTATNMSMSSLTEIDPIPEQFCQKHAKILVTLVISHRSVEFLDVNTKNTISEHKIENINCACQDSNDLRYFAYITKESNLHYCHVFCAESSDFSSEIIMTLGQAFEVAYQLALRDGITFIPLTSLNDIIKLAETKPTICKTQQLNEV